jgi:hypothetical protein
VEVNYHGSKKSKSCLSIHVRKSGRKEDGDSILDVGSIDKNRVYRRESLLFLV